MKRALSIVFVVALLVCLAWAQAPQGAPAGQQPGAAGQAGQAGQAAPAGRGGRAAITPRILSFEASPVSIKPGDSFILSWSTEAGTPSIDNGIGAVYQRGTIKVTPKATTTYTLTMSGGTVTKSVTVTVAGTTPVAAAPDASCGPGRRSRPSAARRCPTRAGSRPDLPGACRPVPDPGG